MKIKSQFSTENDGYLQSLNQAHQVRYFAMLNNAVAIEGTEYEGGLNSKAIAYYEDLLNLELPHCPVNLNIGLKKTAILKQKLADLKEVTLLLENHYKQVLGNKISHDSSKLVNEVLRHIEKASIETGVCYFPSGWRNNDGGHYATLKLRRLANGHYALSLLNHGGGMEYHRRLSQSGSKQKRCYQSNEYEVDLTSENGRLLLQYLIGLMHDLDRKKYGQDKINPYSEKDLYGLLETYGQALETLDKLREKSATPQRTGTCTITNIHAAMRDTLIDNDADLKTRKRYHFVIKLRSLMVGFYNYRYNQWPRNLLEWALKEFSVRLNKHYDHILTDEEMLYCGKLQEEIQEWLNADKKQELAQLCAPQEWPMFSDQAPIGNQQLVFNEPKRILEAGLPPQDYSATEDPKPSNFTPETITKILQEAVNVDSSLDKQGTSFKKMYDLMHALPHTTGLEQDPFWDKVPEDQLPLIIDSLYVLISKLKAESTSSDVHFSRSMVLAFIAYDIAAQIAPRCQVFNLNKKYAFGLDDVFSEHYFYQDPIVYIYSLKHRYMGNRRNSIYRYFYL